MIKINKKYSNIIFAIVMSFSMAFAMSFVMTSINIGWVDNFFFFWLRAFSIGFLVALPTSMIVAPLSRKVLCKITREEKEDKQINTINQ